MNQNPLSIKFNCECGAPNLNPVVPGKFYCCSSCIRRYTILNGQIERSYMMAGNKAKPSPEITSKLLPLFTEFERSYQELITIDQSGMRETFRSSSMIKKIIDLFFEINRLSDVPFIAVHPFLDKERDGLTIFHAAVTMALKYEKAGVLLPGILNDYTRAFYNSLTKS
jgi:hypothetical protein